MISTVTTVTTTAITGVLAGSFALITTLLLLALLVEKEIVSAAEGKPWHRLNRNLTVVIVPLGIAFLAIVVVEVLKAIS
ncbi:MAG: hypothetical protein M3220_08515 [Chloroflexota bacterium]|nr:hypothetical protein [Chloroflexota bacterium]